LRFRVWNVILQVTLSPITFTTLGIKMVIDVPVSKMTGNPPTLEVDVPTLKPSTLTT
jgi:hypothetical protein